MYGSPYEIAFPTNNDFQRKASCPLLPKEYVLVVSGIRLPLIKDEPSIYNA